MDTTGQSKNPSQPPALSASAPEADTERLPPPIPLEPTSTAAATTEGVTMNFDDGRGGETGALSPPAIAPASSATVTPSGGGSNSTPSTEKSGNGQTNNDGRSGTAADKEKDREGGSRPAKRPRQGDSSQQQGAGQLGLPKSMVRRIMKLGEDTRNISNEALIVVSKASELFLEKFAAQAFDHAEKRGRRLIKYQDVSDVRVQDNNLLFLEAVVPP